MVNEKQDYEFWMAVMPNGPVREKDMTAPVYALINDLPDDSPGTAMLRSTTHLAVIVKVLSKKYQMSEKSVLSRVRDALETVSAQ